MNRVLNMAVTLGNVIVGGSSLELDPNKSLFQHEYGHYLQSQKWGIAWPFVFGIPSLGSMVFDPENHDTFYTEVDANNKAFEYFRKTISDFDYNNWIWNSNPTYDYLKSGLTPEEYILLHQKKTMRSNVNKLMNDLSIQ